MNTTVLKQGNNFMVVVGKLKAKNLSEHVAKSSGKEYIKGKIVVEVVDGEEIVDVEFDIFSMEGNKNYTNIKEIKDTFISKQDAISEEYIDNIRVIGAVTIEDFYNQDNELISFNKYSLIQAYKSTESHKAELDLDLVIKGLKEDSYGKLQLDGFVIGYNEEIIDIKTNIDIPLEFSEPLKAFYKPGDVAPLKIKVGTAVVENENVKSFGIVDTTSYRKHWLLLGGTEAKNSLTESEIQRASDLRLSVLNEIKAKHEARNSGFGGNSSGGGFGAQPQANSGNPFM